MVETFKEQATLKKPDEAFMKQTVSTLIEKSERLERLSKEQQDASGYSRGNERHIGNMVEGALAFIKSKGGRRLGSSARFFIRNGSPRRDYQGTHEYLVNTLNQIIGDYNSNNAVCGSLVPCLETGCPAR